MVSTVNWNINGLKWEKIQNGTEFKIGEQNGMVWNGMEWNRIE